MYLLEIYGEIYGWPYLSTLRIYHEFRFRILLKYQAVFRTQIKELLKNEMFGNFKAQIKSDLKGFKLIGVKDFDGRYELFLKLPARTVNFLGPWYKPPKEEKPYGHYGVISKFQKEAERKINSVLHFPLVSVRELEKTREVEIRVSKGTFCEHPFWGDFKPEKWETWKNDFIRFFRDISTQAQSC
jgi:hypothetical protein